MNLREFSQVAERRGDIKRVASWGAAAESLAVALGEAAWDGQWYRRAFFDDGTPLGSMENDECQIDSIAQSWAVLSGAGDDDRARKAMDAVDERLVNREDRLVLLFTPAFDKTTLDPGYIKGYVPGIRENGGQYTHAAIWSAMAFAELGDGDKSHGLFRLLNPIHQADSRASIHRYKVEPYVVAADIYSSPAHLGRGGWTWYTGAAAWLYRAGLESILGFRKFGQTLRIDPCIPREWNGFEIIYRHGRTPYRIAVESPDLICRGVSRLSLDGSALDSDAGIPLVDDGKEHEILVVLG